MKILQKDDKVNKAIEQKKKEEMITQKQVEMECGVTKPTLWKARTSQAVSITSARKIAKYFGEDVKDMFEVVE